MLWIRSMVPAEADDKVAAAEEATAADEMLEGEPHPFKYAQSMKW